MNVQPNIESLEVWLVTGSQHLYGDETLAQVAANSQQVVEGLNASQNLPVRVVFKPIVTTAESITQLCREANAAADCIGLVCWMHTFSPAKMWIAGLLVLDKPLVHLHTQFNRDLPWSTIDMDFMNLNQSAHGGREFGFICARLRKPRKVVVGHWQEADVQQRLADWMRAAAAVHDMRNLKVARLGDNMRQVAVTEGDKVEAQVQLHGLNQLPGLAVQRLMADGYGFGAEGDWKTAALVRVIKTMTAGLPGGTSFMEDYTYHFHPGGPQVLGAHMLEICPTVAADTPSCEIHPLGIGGKEDPVRLVFAASAGSAINVAMIDLGDRFRMLVNEVDAVLPGHPLPNLPVAHALWSPRPDLKTAAAAWIYAGGPHHTAFSQAATSEHIEDFAEMFGIECLFIQQKTHLRDFKQQLRDS